MARLGVALLAAAACDGPGASDDAGVVLEPLAGIQAALGEPNPRALPQLAEAWSRGEEAATRAWTPGDGFGRPYGAARCVSCHSEVGVGGKGAIERSVVMTRQTLPDGTQVIGSFLSVHQPYRLASGRPINPLGSTFNVTARRCAPAIAGAGLFAAVDDESVLALEDPVDRDGDGISGEANYSFGAIGRYGWKAGGLSIETTVRAQMFVHLGLTSGPLAARPELRFGDDADPSDADPSDADADAADSSVGAATEAQTTPPGIILLDTDSAVDPELSEDALHDLTAWASLLAPLRPDAPTEETRAGQALFAEVGCADCHVPSLTVEGRWTISPYTDLLLHDMGEELADSVSESLAGSRDFRTAPLWTAGLGGPYLHDCRADTIDEAVGWHGGEAAPARMRYAALDDSEKAAIAAFVTSLGGAADVREQAQGDGLDAPGDDLPSDRRGAFDAGRALFVQRWTVAQGLGPALDGSSCAGCHARPGTFTRISHDGDVFRQGRLEAGVYVAPSEGTYVHRYSLTALLAVPSSEAEFVVRRSAPSLLGIAGLEGLARADVTALADPMDEDGDGIAGRAADLPGDELGRFGWQAQWDTLEAAAAACAGAHLGLTTTGEDGDDAPDPELSSAQIDQIATYLRFAGRSVVFEPPAVERGFMVFQSVGCDSCHRAMIGSEPSPFTDLLLHDVSSAGAVGAADGVARPTEHRTPPLRALSSSAPYLHDSTAYSIDDAIRAHAGESREVTRAYESLSTADQAAVLDFLGSL